MEHAFFAKTVESVHSIDEPQGVSWLTAYSFVLDGDPSYELLGDGCSVSDECEDCNRWGVFPVPTQELIGKKGTGLAIGDTFLVWANLDAASPTDIDPTIINYQPPVSDEEFLAFVKER